MKERKGDPRRRHVLCLAVLPLLLLLAACGSDGTTDLESGDLTTTTAVPTTTTTSTTAVLDEECSMSTIRFAPVVQPSLSAPAAATRRAIIDAAEACDFDALDELAPDEFSFTFGDASGGPAAYWRAREAEGEPVLRLLVQVLLLPPVDRRIPDTDTTYVAWPSADQEVRTDADWEALKAIYTDDQIAAWKASGIYTGYRAAITTTGRWMYFVAGD